MELTPTLPPTDSQFESLRIGLSMYNETYTSDVFREKVASFVKDETGSIVGGILGEINWNWMHIQGLWVDERFRKDGWGMKLLTKMEKYALSKGTNNIRLETTTFQALGFYVKAGYTVFGELPDMPKGHTSYFLQKQMSI